jgi:hypothetical protein
MKKSPKKVVKNYTKEKPFTTEDAKRFFGAVSEEFRGRFTVIEERINFLDEKTDRRFSEVTSRLDEHSQMLGRLMLDTEEIKSGMREKVSLQDFNKLETRLVLLESIVLGGTQKTKTKSK